MNEVYFSPFPCVYCTEGDHEKHRRVKSEQCTCFQCNPLLWLVVLTLVLYFWER